MVKLVYSDEVPEQEAYDHDAMAWVVRLASGDSTPEEHAEFRRWRDSSVENFHALVQARSVWQQVGLALPVIDREKRNRTRWARLARALPIAASILLTLGIGQTYLSTWRFDQVTASGEQRNVTLPDGSRMTMSGDTALNIDFAHGERRIQIGRGEAVLAVRHDPRVPFVVEAGDTQFRDVGTVFSVARRDASSRLVVASGVVEASLGSQKLTVLGGQSLVADSRLEGIKAVDARSELAWTRGRLVFGDRTLREIVAEVAPHYGRHIILLGTAAGDDRLSASIEINHIDEWLDALKTTRGVRITRLPGYTFIS